MMTSTPAAQVASQKMTRREAMEQTKFARRSLREAWLALLTIHEREGWRAMGYSSWAEYAQVEFAVSRAQAFRLLVAAGLAREVSNWRLPADQVPIVEAQFRELAKVSCPELRKAIWDEAQADGDTTAAALRELVDREREAERDEEEEEEQVERQRKNSGKRGPPPKFVQATFQFWSVQVGGKLVKIEDLPDGRARVHVVRPGDVLRYEGKDEGTS